MHHSGFRSMCCGYVVQVIRYLFYVSVGIYGLGSLMKFLTLIIATAILIAS